MAANNFENKVDVSKKSVNDIIFALDIGTRSVIGVVAYYENEILQVLDVEVCEHTQRAMVDGQIEDIDMVARVVASVKEKLEKRMGYTFQKVHVAAAGRALKTVPTSIMQQLDKGQIIDSEIVTELEAEAIQQAQEELLKQPNMMYEADFFCVGYSVVKYYLDDYPISTLLSHKGKTVQVDIIATFLPVEVVDSLTLCMKKNNLQIASLTLEPIAAMNAVIPQELRIINLAIVDIGAGTSDIAISNEGSVIAYTMATVAGDEITEAIVKNLLVDFNTAERIKSELSDANKKIEYTNILGMSMETPAEEILNGIDSDIDILCEEISQRIIAINGGSPAAVFVVGGGSKMPRICDKIANKLYLDPTKVVVSSNNYMKRVVSAHVDVVNTEFVTPVGIALTAALLIKNGIHITVNGRDTAVLKNGAITVMDALQVSGFDTNQIMGRSGKSVTFELNGQKKIIRGGYPTPAEIFVNNVAASISTPIKAGDEVKIISCIHGEDANPMVSDIIDQNTSFEVYLNGGLMQVGAKVLINDKKVPMSQPIRNQDIMNVHYLHTLYDLLEDVGLDETNINCMIGDMVIDGKYVLKPGDNIHYMDINTYNDPQPNNKANLEQLDIIPMHEMTDMKQTNETVAPVSVKTQEEHPEKTSKSMIQVTINRRLTVLEPKIDHSPYQFVDMLNYVDMDPSKPKGNYVMKLNNRDASFLDFITDGDVIEIRWDNA